MDDTADMVMELWPWSCCCEEPTEGNKEFVLLPMEDDNPGPEERIDPAFRLADIVVDTVINKEV